MSDCSDEGMQCIERACSGFETCGPLIRGGAALWFFVMSERVAARAGTVAALLLLAVACSNVCHLVGCSSAETLEVKLPVALSEIESGQVSGCRNDQCWQGEIAVLDAKGSLSAGRTIGLMPGVDEGPASVRAEATIREEGDGSLMLRFDWHLKDYRAIRKGDALRMSVLSAAGDEIVRADESVTDFSDDYPNGEDCDETPCRSATIEVR